MWHSLSVEGRYNLTLVNCQLGVFETTLVARVIDVTFDLQILRLLYSCYQTFGKLVFVVFC